MTNFKDESTINRVTAVICLLLIFGGVFLFMKDRGPWSDEGTHLAQIQQFYNHNLKLVPSLTNIPGYHLIMAGLAQVIHNPSMQTIRGFNLIFGVLSMGLFWLIARLIREKSSGMRLLQYIFFPLIFPFYFLVFTDIMSLFFVLLALYLALKRNYAWSGFFCLVSMGIRQNNVVWLVMIPILTYYYQEDVSWNRESLIRLGKSCWTFCLGLALFGVFVAVNHGVALGDKEFHPVGSIHTGNVFFMLFLYCVLFFPGILAHLPQTFRALGQNWHYLASTLLLFLIYLLTFKNTHHYNLIMTDYFFRNYLLGLFTSNLLWRVWFFIPVMLAFWDILSRPLLKKEYNWVYVFIVLALVPSWLIEQRYTIIPFTLLLLLRRDEVPEVEMLTGTLHVFLAAFFIASISWGRFFL